MGTKSGSGPRHFFGGSCILGLGLVYFRARASVSIGGRVRVFFFFPVHLGCGLSLG